MSDRPTAEIVADLRDPGFSLERRANRIAREAADRLAELDALVAQATRVIKDRDEWNDSLVADAADLQERIDALRPPCPTCGGNDGRSSISSATICPDCVDGKVSIEWCVATYNAVHADHGRRFDGEFPHDVLAYLRSVKP